MVRMVYTKEMVDAIKFCGNIMEDIWDEKRWDIAIAYLKKMGVKHPKFPHHIKMSVHVGSGNLADAVMDDDGQFTIYMDISLLFFAPKSLIKAVITHEMIHIFLFTNGRLGTNPEFGHLEKLFKIRDIEIGVLTWRKEKGKWRTR